MSTLKVSVVVQEPIAPFELGVAHEVFGIDRTAEDGPSVEFRLVTEVPERAFVTDFGAAIRVDGDLSDTGRDLVVIPSAPIPFGTAPAVLDFVRAVHARGGHLLATCSGVFALAEAGLLDRRAPTVHWRYAGEFSAAYPHINASSRELFSDDDRVVTSADTAAGIDAALHLVRQASGTRAATAIARRMVAPVQRESGQLQYLERPVIDIDSSGIGVVLDEVAAHPERGYTVTDLAAWAGVSPRTLTRRFHEMLGVPPMTWVAAQRIRRAQELLEETDLGVDLVAEKSGFADPAALRHHFRTSVGMAPTEYRKAVRR